MSIFADLKMYGRFAWGLRSFLRHTLTLEEAKAIVHKRMAEREDNFLRLVRKGIFGYSKSPYLPLLKLAQCEMGDLENMVREKGLEGTLMALREAGVYISFEEFKGRKPIVRNGHVFSVRDHNFDNPYLSPSYYTESGGTTGAGTRVALDLGHLAEQAPLMMLAYDAHGVLNLPSAIWHGILPDPSGITSILRSARFGQVTRKWFSPIQHQDLKRSVKNRLATLYIINMGRLFGVPIPKPEIVHLDEAAVIASWIAETLKTYHECFIRASISKVLRICLAAREKGLDLKGAVFTGGGEPPTPAKVTEVKRSGVRLIPNYFFSEIGIAAMGCVHPIDENDLHLFRDILALISHPRLVPNSVMTVNAFYFTTLLPTAPKLMMNVESDDYGLVENRSCGCPLESYGFTDHLRHIRSFGKLTSEGVTLVGSEMVRILEEVLPARFGGSPLDYQLLEEEDDQGFTQLSLLVNPKIKIDDERTVIKVLLETLGQGSVSADLTRTIWSQAGKLRVKRMKPIWTARGKLMPLHIGHRSKRSTGI